MSDGGEERNREAEQSARKRVRPEDFSRAVARIAVAQVSEGVRFEGVKQSALDALSNIAVRYLCDLGKSAKYYAELAGRSESNVFDVVKGLEDLSSTRGFSGASEVDCCASESGALRDVIDYVASVEEIPFACPVPRFPASRSSSRMHSISMGGESSSEKHIPEWLPVFPEPHAYLSSPVLNEKAEDRARIDRAEQLKQQRNADNAIMRLQQRILSGASAGPSGLEETRALDCNQFLAPPLPAGEKEVSEIPVPTRLVSTEGNEKHGPFVEMFAPAIDTTKGGDLDSTNTERRLPLDGRPVVHFRLKTGKKMLGEDVDVGLRDGGEDSRVLAPNTDDKRDEKKRRAEQILQQAMIDPQDTSQNVN